MPITLEHTPAALTFRLGDNLVGAYQLADDFKPFLHPLATPKGRVLTAACPHDHKHHKGLMFALVDKDLCFWEEYTDQDRPPGRQRATSTTLLPNGLRQQLRWEALDGTLPTFDETREVTCRLESTKIIWTWHTHLTALRDLTLTQSRWSHKVPGGPLVNYHGLGIRFVRDLAMGGGRTLTLDGQPQPNLFAGMGTTPAHLELTAQLDAPYPRWQPLKCGVSISQSRRDALFSMDGGFAYLALGPSNLGPVQLAMGATLDCAYQIALWDLD
jgi:hypothetical protein